MKIAKVAITNVCLWAGIWTPYAVVAMLPVFGYRNFLTPLVSQLPAFFAKTASCLNPIVFAISHPKYRDALSKRCACLGIGEKASSNENEEGTKLQTVA